MLGVQLLFSIRTNQTEARIRTEAKIRFTELPANPRRNNEINRIITNLYLYNTIKGDVALTNISRETNRFYDPVQYPKSKFFAFPQPRYVLTLSTV